MHDRIAELAGLRTELAICENGPRESRRDKTDEVRAEITRVRDELENEAEKLEKRSEDLASNGQDVAAAEAAAAARGIRTSLGENDDAAPAKAARGKQQIGKRTAAAAKPPEHT
ncbi:hypothetical protein ACWCP6_18055 [Streptomyces sp. NPDC002004]